MMNMDEAYGGPVSNPPGSECHPARPWITPVSRLSAGSGTITPYDIIQVGFMGSKGEAC